MVKVPINGVERYYDALLKENLEGLKAYVSHKWDGIVLVGGYEGDGKSVLASQCALYVDPTYNLSRCTFTAAQFREAVLNAKEGEAIVFDEAQEVFESVNRSKEALLTKDMLTRIRRRRLFIFICVPDFFRVSRYIFIHRSRAFIRVYADGLKRGFFAFYNRERKHELYLKGKKEENPRVVKPNFSGCFTNWSPLDEDVYDTKKEAAERRPEEADEPDKYELVKARILVADFLTVKQRAMLLDKSERQLYRDMHKSSGNGDADDVTNSYYNLEGASQ